MSHKDNGPSYSPAVFSILTQSIEKVFGMCKDIALNGRLVSLGHHCVVTPSDDAGTRACVGKEIQWPIRLAILLSVSRSRGTIRCDGWSRGLSIRFFVLRLGGLILKELKELREGIF
jgi:hypothetical protein